MKKKSILFFVSIFFLHPFFSCRKEVGRAPITYIPQEIKNCFSFKAGSFWIYQDSVSGDYDSVECVSVTDDTLAFLYGKNHVSAYEQMQLSYPVPYPYSSYPAYNGITISTEPTHAIDGVFQINTFGKYYGQGGYSFSQSMYLVYPFITGTHFINSNSDTVKISALLDHYTINSITFDSVIVSDVIYHNQNYSKNARYYTSKGIGIIQRIRAADTLNYKLVSYHIE